MDDMNKRDREFIEEVWKKARYVQHVREKEEMIIQQERLELRKKRIKFFSLLFIGAAIILMFILLSRAVGEILIYVTGIYSLVAASYYENSLRYIKK